MLGLYKKGGLNMKRMLLLLVILLVTGCTLNVNEKSNKCIIATSFPGYDFARAIVKDTDIDVKLLLSPGVDMHDYELTPKDMVDIENAELFIYVGGESDEWVKKVLNTTDKKLNTYKLMDAVKLLDEEIKPGMESDGGEEKSESDEHVWTSPINAIKIVEDLTKKISDLFPEYESIFDNNSKSYIEEIKLVDSDIRDLINNTSKKTLIFADRFPLLYFTREYNLDYYAAFPGCAHETEASAKTIAFLIEKVKRENIPVIFTIELSSGNIAETIKKETGVKVSTFETAHNVTKSDYDNGVTYVDLMKRNISALREALK